MYVVKTGDLQILDGNYPEKTISGTYYGSVRPDIDFPILADLDMDKKLNLDDLISRTYKFDEMNEGFRLLVSGGP